MSSCADKITKILGLTQARNLLDALDDEGTAHERIAREQIAKFSQDMQQSFALIEIGHMLDSIITHQKASNDRLGKLEQNYNGVMSGQKPGCRHLDLMEKRFWRVFAVGISMPILIGIILYVVRRLL